jgi:hypothetical protein
VVAIASAQATIILGETMAYPLQLLAHNYRMCRPLLLNKVRVILHMPLCSAIQFQQVKIASDAI